MTVTEPSGSSAVSPKVATVKAAEVASAAMVTVCAPVLLESTKPPSSATVSDTSSSAVGAGETLRVKAAAVPSVTSPSDSMLTAGPLGWSLSIMLNVAGARMVPVALPPSPVWVMVPIDERVIRSSMPSVSSSATR